MLTTIREIFLYHYDMDNPVIVVEAMIVCLLSKKNILIIHYANYFCHQML